MTEIISNLELFGFTKKEAQVYIELLKTGSTSIGTLEKNLGEKRQTLLYSLKKLINKGYINVIDSRNYPIYSAEDPKIIQFEYEEKKKKLTNTIKSLQNLRQKDSFDTKVKFYPADQIENLFSKLTFQKEYFVITDFDYTIRYRKDGLVDYRKRRMNNSEIQTNIISYHTPLVEEFLQEYGTPIGDKYSFIEKGDYDFSTNIELLENNTVLFLSTDPQEKYGLTIQSKGFYESEKALFDTLWSIGRKQ